MVKKGKKHITNEIENVSRINTKIEDFFKRIKNKRKPIGEIFISDIVKQLKNVTPQSTLIARALNKDNIKRKILDPTSFKAYLEYFNGEVKNINRISAFEYGGTMYFRQTTSVDTFFNEIVHEGTHALDRVNEIIKDYYILFEKTKNPIDNGQSVDKYIQDLTLDQLVEFRARYYEREFQIISKQEPDYKAIKDMVNFIKEEY
ncbi:hypothetical protein [Tenacibaculum maritimum]|uniref:hypothetical protein n=1 Tax=Tenacibaculum maritimum TaxID=107401 RepID=UPI003876B7E1